MYLDDFNDDAGDSTNDTSYEIGDVICNLSNIFFSGSVGRSSMRYRYKNSNGKSILGIKAKEISSSEHTKRDPGYPD